jgi:hypothetical protein
MARNPGIKLEEWVKAQLKAFYADATRTKASGALSNEGDVRAGPYEFECKDNPNQQSISVPATVWLRTQSAARLTGKIPLIVNRNAHGRFVTLPWWAFEQLLESAHGRA